MEFMQEYLLVILNLILIESLLSIDNAAVIATMVMDLPEKQRSKALRYGIIGAYVFRGLALIFASFLIQIWWLKPLGGAYLLYLFFHHLLLSPQKKQEEDRQTLNASHKMESWLHRFLSPFWSVVVSVELVDLAFSLDNVFAAVSLSDNLYVIWIGVFIGILAMRFVAQGFVRIMEKFPQLEAAAFVVIGILGLKLLLSAGHHFWPGNAFLAWLETEHADTAVSVLTLAVFVFPILIGYFKKKA